MFQSLKSVAVMLPSRKENTWTVTSFVSLGNNTQAACGTNFEGYKIYTSWYYGKEYIWLINRVS